MLFRSLVTETSQYFVFFCRSVCSANLAKCLIINVLRLIIVILFFIAFLNITYTARRSFATNAYLAGLPPISIMKITGHKTESSFMKYIKISEKENAIQLKGHEFFNQIVTC